MEVFPDLFESEHPERDGKLELRRRKVSRTCCTDTCRTIARLGAYSCGDAEKQQENATYNFTRKEQGRRHGSRTHDIDVAAAEYQCEGWMVRLKKGAKGGAKIFPSVSTHLGELVGRI